MGQRKIGFREEEYKTAIREQEVAKKAFDKLAALTKTALNGDHIEDYKVYMEDPFGFTVEKFFELFGNNEPPHSNKEVFMHSKISVDKKEFESTLKAFENSSRKLRELAPTVKVEGVDFNVKEEVFNIYLNPTKKELYESLEKFVLSAKVLHEKHNASGFVNLVRYHTDIQLGDGFVKINPYSFQ